MPLFGEEKDAVKANVLKLLKEKYDIEEEISYLLKLKLYQVVKQETMVWIVNGCWIWSCDRVCAYTSLTAILDSDVSEYTSCAILVDKEELVQ